MTALLKVDGFVDALNGQGQQFEALLGEMVLQYSYQGEPIHEFRKMLDHYHPNTHKVTSEAQPDGALIVTVERLEKP